MPRLFLLLFLAFLSFISASALGSVSDSAEADEFDQDGNEMDRSRRIPYYFPRNLQRSRMFDEEEFGDNDEFFRQRRFSSLASRYYPSPKFQYWKHLVNADKERSNFDGGDDEMIRKRRIPYFYPKYNYNNLPKYTDYQDKRTMKKRAIPYFFPNMKYNFLSQSNPDFKRPFPFKRQVKRTLGETLENDDVGAFGYDKKKKSSPFEDMMEMRQEEEEAAEEEEEESLADEEDKKKKRKRTLKKRTG